MNLSTKLNQNFHFLLQYSSHIANMENFIKLNRFPIAAICIRCINFILLSP